jgi:hypothetical protein
VPCPPGEPGGARTSCLTLLRPSLFFATGTDAGRRAMRRSAHLHSRLRSHRRLGPWHRFGFRLRPTYLFGPPFLHCRPVLPNGRARRCLGHRLRLNPRRGDGGRTPFFDQRSALPGKSAHRQTPVCRSRSSVRWLPRANSTLREFDGGMRTVAERFVVGLTTAAQGHTIAHLILFAARRPSPRRDRPA